MKSILQKLLHTLNQLDVRGEENVARLLACIRAVKAMLDALEEHKKEETPDA